MLHPSWRRLSVQTRCVTVDGVAAMSGFSPLCEQRRDLVYDLHRCTTNTLRKRRQCWLPRQLQLVQALVMAHKYDIRLLPRVSRHNKRCIYVTVGSREKCMFLAAVCSPKLKR